MRSILSEYKIHNADVTLRYDATADDLIDVIEGNRIYMPCIYVLNKIDQISVEELDIIYKIPHCVPISAHHKWNFDDRKSHYSLSHSLFCTRVRVSDSAHVPFGAFRPGYILGGIQHYGFVCKLLSQSVSVLIWFSVAVLEKLWVYLNLVRIYTKPRGQLPDYDSPVILSHDRKSIETCTKIHKSLVKEFKVALVWGSSVKHQPQRVGKDHELADEDVVQIIKKV